MTAKQRKPEYMIVYKCTACGQESGFTELDKAFCRFCDTRDRDSLVIVSRQSLTPEVMAARLKAVTDNMMKNLQAAFQTIPDLDKDILGEGKDPEEEMLKLMARAKELGDKVQRLELKNPVNTKDQDESVA